MDPISRCDLTKLTEDVGVPRASIFLPLHPSGPETVQDAIRLKNLVRRAEKLLAEEAKSKQKAHEILAPARALLEDSRFFTEHSANGLAFFAAPRHACHYRVNRTFEELVVVGERFHIKPVIDLFLHDGRFHVLALSKGNVRLYEGTRSGLSDVKLPSEIPNSLEQSVAVGGTNIEKSLQHHAAPAGKRPGTEVGVHHGQGRPKDSEEKLLVEYFRRVAGPLERFLRDERIPLVLVAVEHLQALFRRIYRSPYLLDEGVTGSPDSLPEETLAEKSREIVRPWFLQSVEKAKRRFEQLRGTDRVSSDLDRILLEARGGRVDTVFAARDVAVWDRENEDGPGGEAPEPSTDAGTLDLLSVAIEETLGHGGEAYVIDSGSLPGDAEGVAAILRW